MKDEEKLAKFNHLVDRIEANIDKLIEYEYMRAANFERMLRGESLAYNEEAFLKLLEKKV